MRVPLSWLKDFVDMTVSIPELAQKLTFANLEVEDIEYIGVPKDVGLHAGGGSAAEGLVWDRDKIFIGQIVEVKQHPNADRLTLAIVDYAHGEPIQVVTGAPNIHVGEKGQKVVLALEGSRLYDGHKPGQELMTLKKSKIRGVESGSMVCSEKELGISDEHEGIIILPGDAPVGLSLQDYMGDIVFDIKINPNMARCQSILGIAREVAALIGTMLKESGKPVNAQANGPASDFVKIEIENPALCSRYSAALIRDIAIGPSPFLMQRRLILAGMRPISNIVDITNYVMIERGQPLHAFDYDRLVGRAGGKPTIIVRAAQAGEKMQTLDGVVRELTPTDLLIADTAGPIAIAGVMGGAETEVSDATRNILLESANFDFIAIRRTTQEQHLPSEAATRFGRGISPVQTIPAAVRASEMMGTLAAGRIDPVIADAYPRPLAQSAVRLTQREVTRLLGISLSPEEIKTILIGLDFKVDASDPEAHMVTPPDYRLDVDGSDDVIEEIVRIYGYDRIPSTLISDALPPQVGNPALEREERARDLLIDTGLQEIVTYTMTTPGHEALLTPVPEAQGRVGAFDPRPLRPYVEIENPISAERAVMRQSLLPSMLDVLAANLRYTRRAALFEIGKVYLQRIAGDGPEENPGDQAANLPREKYRLGIILTGPRDEPSWQNADTRPVDFYDLKGVVESFIAGLHVGEVAYASSNNPLLHPGRGAVLHVGNVEGGVFGELHPVVRERWGLPIQVVLVGEFDLEVLLGPISDRFRVKALPRYPAVVQDIALIVDDSTPAARVHELIRQTGGAQLANAWLFDVYRGEPLLPDKKSLAFRLTFQSPDRGLTDADAAKIREKIVQRLVHELAAELRSG
ncbi:MAG: phenylalanine--tRNA ligase subunit beta [Anaerolineae bacterium]